MTTEIITNIIYIVLTIVAAVFTRYIVPVLKQRVEEDKMEALKNYIEASITLVEKTDDKGSVKFENVVSLAKIYANDKNIIVTDEQLEAFTQYLFTVLDKANFVNKK